MRILLTGGSGMLGRAILRLAPDNRVEILAPPRGALNLLDRAAIDRYLAANSCDFVVHAAAKVGGIAANIADPAGFLVENAQISLNLISAAADAGVTHLLNIGSSCIYPKDYLQPLKEEYMLAAPLEPTNEGYAIAKILALKHCEYLSRQRGLAYRTIVPPNLYGPDDHFASSGSHLVASIIHKMHAAVKSGAETVEIWGDGTARREFLYIDDLASWIVGLSRDAIAALPSILNVGCGRDHSVLEYYQAAARVLKFAGRFRFDTGKPGGMAHKLVDSTLAGGYGWRPQVSLHDGLVRTYESYLKAMG